MDEKLPKLGYFARKTVKIDQNNVGNYKKHFRIPDSILKKHRLNKVISKYVTRDMFPKTVKGKEKFEYWKKSPLKAITYLDKTCRRQGYQFMKNSKDTSSPMIKLLLKIKKENKMEQVNENIEARKKIEETKFDRKSPVVVNETDLTSDVLERIKERSIALAREDKTKQELVNQAKEKGWVGVTVDEIDMDLSDNYRKLSNQINKVREFDADSLKLLDTMRALKRDKLDLYKFQMTMNVRLQELEERKAQRKSGEKPKKEVFNFEVE